MTARPGFTRLEDLDIQDTLADELIETADDLRDLATEFGIRRVAVHLVRLQWSGGERGRGEPVILEDVEIQPNPKVLDLANLQEVISDVGLREVGEVLVDGISGTYTFEQLYGRNADGSDLGREEGFFYELAFVQRDRSIKPVRRRFTPTSTPSYQAGRVAWSVRLARAQGDRQRGGDLF